MTRFDPKRLVCGHVVVLGLLVLFAGRPGVARPIEDGVQCRVVVGWSSRVSRDGGLVPVSVTLANRVIATDAVIELRQLDRLGRSEVVVRREVVVPVPSEQTHQLLLQLDPDCELQVRVTFSERSLRPYEEMPPVAATGKRLALFVGMTDFLFRRSYYRGTYLFVSVDGETLPRDPLCYDGLHLVAISGDALMALRPNQCEALHRWVLTGGRVAVLGATGSVRGSLGWRKLTRGMTADVGNTGVVPFGMGWLGCDADDSYTSLFWEEDREAMQQFFPEPLADEGGFLRLSSSTGGVFADLAGRTVRRGSEAFSLFWAGLILGTYLLLIGPLAVWAARRWGRPWVRPAVFYAAVPLFGTIAGVYGAVVHSEYMKVARVSILDGTLASDAVRGRNLHWVYSPRHARYLFGIEARGAVTSTLDRLLGAVGRDHTVMQQGSRRRVEARLPAHATSLFSTSWYGETEWGDIQCIRGGTFPEISFPKELPVQYVCLATRDCHLFYGRHPETGNWLPREQPRPWRRLSAPGVLDPVWRGGRISSDGRFYVPSLRGQLLEYVLWVSFVHIRDDEFGSGVGNPPAAGVGQMGMGWGGAYRGMNPGYYGRSDLEERLNIHRLVASGGEVLLVFLRPASDLLGIAQEKGPPDVTRIDVLRLKLPPGPVRTEANAPQAAETEPKWTGE